MKWFIMAVDQRGSFDPGQTAKELVRFRYSMGVCLIARKNLFSFDGFRITMSSINKAIASGYQALQTRKRLNWVTRVSASSCAASPEDRKWRKEFGIGDGP